MWYYSNGKYMWYYSNGKYMSVCDKKTHCFFTFFVSTTQFREPFLIFVKNFIFKIFQIFCKVISEKYHKISHPYYPFAVYVMLKTTI